MSVIAPATAGICPPGAAALGVSGLGSVCQAAAGAAGLAGSAASAVTGVGVDSVLGALGSWVSAGAAWLLDQVGAVLTTTTSIDLGASWFGEHYETMAALCGVIIVPLLLFGVIQSIYRQDLSMLMRSVLVNVPLALVLTAVAVKLVELGLRVTDDLSAAVASGAGLDAGHFMSTVTAALSDGGAGQPAAPSFVVFLGGLAVVAGAFLVWIELLLRAAAVYVAVLFLPLALASLAWPAISHWCRRLVDTLVALILGKFVIVSVLSLAAGALDAGSGGTGQGAGSIAAVLGGAALLLLASFTPWALIRLLPFMEGGAVAHLEGVSQRARQTAKVPTRGLAQTALRVAAGSALGGPAGLLVGATGGTGPGSGLGLAGSQLDGKGGSGVAPRRLPSTGSPDGRSVGAVPAVSSHGSGIGSVEDSGHGIPRWEPDPEISALARQWELAERTDPSAGLEDTAGPRPSDPLAGASGRIGGGATLVSATAPSAGAGPTAMGAEAVSSTGTGVGHLPRQTGVRLVDRIERDELGARLVSRPLPAGSGVAVRAPASLPPRALGASPSDDG